MKYRLGSLFSGIGGFELGFEWTEQFHTVFQVEREPFCQKVLAKHWPDVPRFDDVCTVGSHNLPTCDVLIGGFPCQDLSFAGKGAGLDGARSGLWREFSRIIGELRPRVVCVENVPALTLRGLDRVLADFASHGYDAEWQIVSAAALNAPHLRERLFIVAYPQRLPTDEQRNATEVGGWANQAKQTGLGSQREEILAYPNRERREERNPQPIAARARQPGGSSDAGKLPNWAGGRVEQPYPLTAAQPRVHGMADGVPSRVGQLKALGNAVVPAVAQFVAQRILSSGLLP